MQGVKNDSKDFLSVFHSQIKIILHIGKERLHSKRLLQEGEKAYCNKENILTIKFCKHLKGRQKKIFFCREELAKLRECLCV